MNSIYKGVKGRARGPRVHENDEKGGVHGSSVPLPWQHWSRDSKKRGEAPGTSPEMERRVGRSNAEVAGARAIHDRDGRISGKDREGERDGKGFRSERQKKREMRGVRFQRDVGSGKEKGRGSG